MDKNEVLEPTFYEQLIYAIPHEMKSKMVMDYMLRAISAGALLSLGGLQSYVSYSDAEMSKWESEAPKLFDWFKATADYINIDRASKKMLDFKAVAFLSINEFNRISSRGGEKLQDEERNKKKVLELKIIGNRSELFEEE